MLRSTSSEKETLKLPDNVIKPYCETELGWPQEQKALIIWDAFKDHICICDSVKIRAEELNIVTADVPKNLTHRLSPMDLTVNRSINQMEREEFSLYYTECIKKALTEQPNIDVAETSVDTRKTVVRPWHAKSLC